MSRLPTVPELVGTVKGILRRLDKMETAPRLRSASIGAGGLRFYDGGRALFEGGGGVDVRDGGDIVVDEDGEIRTSNFVPDVSGWRALADLLEINNLKLRGGIIGNDDLANPVDVDTGAGNDIGFGVATTVATYGVDTIPVPVGYTRAVVQAIATASVRNPTPDPDFLYVSAEINGMGGAERPALAGGNGGYAMGVASAIRTLTGLSGGSISVGCRLRTNTAAWASNSGNSAGVDALVVFRR